MKVKSVALLSLIGVAISITPAFAGPVGIPRTLSPEQREAVLAPLQTQRTQLARQMPTPPKGVALLQWNAKRMQLDDLISRINNGEPVAPEEIDQVLQPANR